MRRRRTSLILVAGLMTLAIPAGAAPPETITTTQNNLVETFNDSFPPNCAFDNPFYTITTTSNRVEHATLFLDGRAHTTVTDTGTFVATHPTLPDATGKFTIWEGFNDNGFVVNGTFTFNGRGRFDDGTRFDWHFTGHFNVRPNGSVNEFFRCRT